MSDEQTQRPVRISRVLLALAVILGGAIAIEARNPADTPVSEPTYVAQDLDFTEYYEQDFSWETCDETWILPDDYLAYEIDTTTLECGVAEVPVSYEVESGMSNLVVGLIKIPAREISQGAVFINPGGPGESGIEAAQWVTFSENLRDSYDIIGWDPRGVGVSSPIRCSDELDRKSYYELPTLVDSVEESNQVDEFSEAFDEDCKAKNPTWWGMSTANTVRDMDILRQLVTPDLPLNFLGWSYGTTLAMEYIRTFPANAGRMVLDSVTAPDVDAYADDLSSTSAIYDAYLRLFERCAEDRECPGRTVDEVQQVIFAARDAAEAGTLYGSYGTQAAPTGFDGYTLGSAYLIHHGIFALTYSASERAYLDFKMGMQELEAGYMTTFEWYGLNLDGYSPDEGTRNNSYEILTVVNCLDVDTRDMHTEAEFRAQQEALEEADPFTAAFFENANGYEEPFEPNAGCFWTEEALEDDLIPDPPAKIAAPVNTSGKSFLVIGSKGDTVTPYEYAVKLAEQIDSTLLTYTGDGHAISYGYSSKCIDDAVDDYLIEGILPESNAECDPDGY